MASGNNAHAEGSNTTASGSTSHAEGSNTTASGSNSHSSGTQTIANHKSQFVFGEFNISDPSTATASNRGTYIEIVGNGTADNARSNARTLDFNGNESLNGNLIPMTTNSQTIGTSTNRWKAVYIGTQSTIGANNKPIYWNNGVPTVVGNELNVSITGNANTANTAASADKLSIARTIKIELDSTSAASFDGTGDITLGVTKTLPVARGGTGQSSVDSTPTNNSLKMVTSGGVYTAIENLKTTLPYARSSTAGGAANSVKAAITFSNSGGATSGITYDGSVARTISYTTVGAAPAGNYAGSSAQGGAANSVKEYITFTNSGNGASSGIQYNGNIARIISYNTIGAAAASHTHYYAGSLSEGGAARYAQEATQLTTGRTLRVKLDRTDPSTAFDGTQNIFDIGVNGKLSVSNGGTGLSSTGNANSVVIGGSSGTTPMQTVQTKRGAFYATADNAKPQFDTLPVAQGGTGKDSYTTNGVLYASASTAIGQATSNTANQILMSNSNKVPIWQSPSTSITNNNSIPPTSTAVYNAINNIKIEDLSNLSTSYVWDSLTQGGAWTTEIGNQNKYVHGISGNTIRLCRGSLADILLQKRIGYYTGSGTSGEASVIRINFNQGWVPRILRLGGNTEGNISGSDEHDYWANDWQIDFYNLWTNWTTNLNKFNPVEIGLGLGIAYVRWVDSTCKAIDIYVNYGFTANNNLSGRKYYYQATA